MQGCQTPQRVSRRTYTTTLQQPTLSQASPKEPSSCPGGEILVVRCLRVWRKEALPPNNFMGLGVPFLWIQEAFQHAWISSVCLFFLRLPFAQRHLMDCGKKLAKVMNSRHFVFTEWIVPCVICFSHLFVDSKYCSYWCQAVYIGWTIKGIKAHHIFTLKQKWQGNYLMILHQHVVLHYYLLLLETSHVFMSACIPPSVPDRADQRRLPCQPSWPCSKTLTPQGPARRIGEDTLLLR